MKKIISTIILTLISILALTNSLASPAFAADDICSISGVSEEVRHAAGCGGGSSQTLPGAIQVILNAIIGISGLIAVIFVIIGGVNYMTSSGDPGKAEKAKKTILYACIGIIVCALSFAIVQWTIAIVNKSNGGGNTEGENEQPTSLVLENPLAFLDK